MGKELFYNIPSKVDDLLMDFAEYTHFDRMAGDPYVGKYFRNPKINRMVTVLWAFIWVAIPVYGIIDMYMDENGISTVKLLFWSAWLVLVFANFLQYRKINS